VVGGNFQRGKGGLRSYRGGDEGAALIKEERKKGFARQVDVREKAVQDLKISKKIKVGWGLY